VKADIRWHHLVVLPWLGFLKFFILKQGGATVGGAGSCIHAHDQCVCQVRFLWEKHWAAPRPAPDRLTSSSFARTHFVRSSRLLEETDRPHPNLDALAKESAGVLQFLALFLSTLVNRIEVFSGRYTFPFYKWGPLPYRFPVLAEVFQHHGFVTALLADNVHLVQENFGFGRGFQSVQQNRGQFA